MFIAGVEIVLEELCETEHLLSFPDKPASGWTTAGNFQFIFNKGEGVMPPCATQKGRGGGTEHLQCPSRINQRPGG